jgi:tetratricopeptide (TPR) repeat protein
MLNSKTIFLFLLISASFLLSNSSRAQRTLSVSSRFPALAKAFQLQEVNNLRAALDEFSRFAGSDDKDLSQTALYYKAICSEQLQQENSEELMKEFNRIFPGSQYEDRIWLNLGRHHFRLKKWDKALENLGKIDGKKLEATDRTEALYKSGVAAFQLQQFDRARVYFRDAKGGSSSFSPSAAYYSAYLNMKDNKLDDALEDLSQASASTEFKSSIPVLKTIVLYKKQSYAQAAAYAESVFADTAKIASPEELHMLTGECWFSLREYEKAAKHFDLYSNSIKSNMPRPLQYRMAFAAYKNNQTDRAITGFRQVAAKLDTMKGKLDTLGQAGLYYLGICYQKKELKQFALNAFDVASSLEADRRVQEDAWFQAGKLSYDLEKYAEAVDILKDFTDKFQDSNYRDEANELIGQGLMNTQDFEAALRYMEKTKVKTERLNLAYQRAAYQRGTVLFNDGNHAKAAELFEISLKNPVDKETQAAARYWLAESLNQERQFAKAEQEYAGCLQLEGISEGNLRQKALYGLAYSQMNQKEYGKARDNFRSCIQECSKTGQMQEMADAQLRLADCLYATKDYAGALKGYDKAIDSQTPDMDYAFFQKGIVYSSMKEFDNARTNFSVVAEKYPGSKWYDLAIFQKAQMEFESGNYQAAIKGYGSIIDNMSGSAVIPYCYLNRGISASNLKEYQVAAKDFKYILDAFPSHSTANSAILGLQEALVQTGEVDQLNGYIAKYKKANPESDALESIEFETCKALYNNQKYDKAIVGFQDYLKNYAGSSFEQEARFYLAESMYRGGNRQESSTVYKEILSNGKSNWFIRSTFRVAELEYAVGNFQEAVLRYQSLLDGVVRSAKDINNASMGLVESKFQLARYDTVSLLCAELLKKENLPVDVGNKASLYSAKVYVGKQEFEKAIDELLNTVNNAQDVNGAEAQYLVGEVFFKQGKHNESLAALFELKSRFAAYPKWYNKGFLLMADNYIAQKEYFQAQATLRSIIENSKDKETVAAAKAKLAGIKTEEM